MNDSERLYAVWMLSAVNGSLSFVYKALRYFTTAGEVYRCNEKMFGPNFTAQDIEPFLNKDLSKAKSIVEYCDIKGIQIIPFSSPEYPRGFRDLKNAPCALFVKGKIPDLKDHAFLGMVGTRRATEVGQKTASTIAYEVSSADVVVVSGLAEGIDTYSHKGSLFCGKPTVAIIAGDVEHIYPKANKELYERITNNGAVISETLPGTPLRDFMFPTRNRLISALSDAVLVVESGEQGGSLITAGHCISQGKPLLAIPGSIYDPMAKGTNNLIKKGATLVTSSDDILKVLNKQYNGKLSIKKRSATSNPMLLKPTNKETTTVSVETTKPKRTSSKKNKEPEIQTNDRFAAEARNAFKLADLSENERKVFGVIADKGPCALDVICQSCGLTFNETVVIVSNLELEDLIKEVGYNNYIVR